MDALRKILILLLTFVAVVLVFVVWTRISDTPEIDPTAVTGESDIEVPDLESEGGQIGEVKVGTIERSRFVTRDEFTGDVSRIFGYEEIRNPKQGEDRWGVVRPYMEIFDKKFTCDIEADKGDIEIEYIAGKPAPGDAQLSGDVQIKFRSSGDGGMRDTTILLDVLDYYSERSEFSTDGPVKIVSADGEMVGEGMVLIYNAQLGRIEDLRIHDLDYMKLKRRNNVASADEPEGAAAKVSPAGSAAENEQVVGGGQDLEDRQIASENAGEGTKSSQQHSYECRLLDDVSIRYGDQMAVANADEVRIVNVWLGSDDQEDQYADGSAVADASNGISANDATAGGDQSIASGTEDLGVADFESAQVANAGYADNGAGPTGGAAGAGEEAVTEILVRCKGGVIVTPMDKIVAEWAELPKGRWVEFKGGPVRVNELAGRDDPIGRTVATCGQIKYDIDVEVLNLMTSPVQEYVTLSVADGSAGLKSQGNVRWFRNEQKAVVQGPGRLWTLGGSQAERVDGNNREAELLFGGRMDLSLASLDDGMNAGGDFTLKQADIAGGVTATNGDSVMSADAARFEFDAESDIEKADLNGSVNFASDSGRLQCDDAVILFAKNGEEKGEPVSVRSTGNAVLEPAAKEGEKPAKFYASAFDYDIVGGDAVAAGPVRFEFYMAEEDAQGQTGQSDVPVVITARDDAQYFAGEWVEFNGDVVGVRKEVTGEIQQKSTFYGDKLKVAFAKPTVEGEGLTASHVEVIGDSVRLESVRTAGEKKISHVRLDCEKFDYDAVGQIVRADGPGQIEINNQGAAPAEKANAGSGLSGPCFASISGFEELIWGIDDAEVIADGGDGQVDIGYLPIVDGEFGSKVLASARDITVGFRQDLAGAFELDSLLAAGGVYYEEAEGNFFKGDKLTFDAVDSIMVVSGTEDDPCFANGARVPRVEYNLSTGEVQTSISVMPGAVDAGQTSGK